MIDDLLKHKRDLQKLGIDAEYLSDMLKRKLKGKDGFGSNFKEHLRIWTLGLFESLESLNVVFDWAIQMLEQEG